MNKKIIICFAILLFISSMVAIGIYIKNNKPHSREINAILQQISINDIINESDGIIVGKVRNSNMEESNAYAMPGETNIVTNTTIEIEHYLFNPKNLTDNEIIIQTPGGTIGNKTTISEDIPIFNNNERCLIIIKKTDNNIFSVYAWKLGKYDLDSNNQLSNKDQFYQFELIFGKIMNVNELEQIFKSTK